MFVNSQPKFESGCLSVLTKVDRESSLASVEGPCKIEPLYSATGTYQSQMISTELLDP
jgi:hypothetical protein